MTRWILQGLRTGLKSTRYPKAMEKTAGVSPDLPSGLRGGADPASVCPADAIAKTGGGTAVDANLCIHCGRCRHREPAIVAWKEGYEWASESEAQIANRLNRLFRRSLYIRYVDAGACGACMSEVRQLDNPYYNFHRLGFFMTPTPRNADILLVAGPVTRALWAPLRATYEAMPTPKRVVAIGACAVSGGVFGSNAAVADGAASAVPVDVTVPGCPPPPLAILHGLLVAVGRKPPRAAEVSP